MFDKLLYFFRKHITYLQSKRENDRVGKTTVTEEFEQCVICGALTQIPISMPIDLRDNYEIGCGQLCTRCAKNRQKETEHENILSDAQMLFIVEQSEIAD